MKIFKLLLLSSITALLSCTTMAKTDRSVATEGGNSSGGGAGIVCRDSKGKVKEAKLYDFFEAENDPENPKKLVTQKLSVDGYIKLAIERASSKQTLIRALNLVRRDWRPLNRGLKLTLTSDIVPRFSMAKPNCKIETIAHYYDNLRKIEVDSDAYEKLSDLDKAGLILHEAIYKINRTIYGQINSIESRQTVAELFVEKPESKFVWTGLIDDLQHIFDHKRISVQDPEVAPDFQDINMADFGAYDGEEPFSTGEYFFARPKTNTLDLIFANKEIFCTDVKDKSQYYVLQMSKGIISNLGSVNLSMETEVSAMLSRPNLGPTLLEFKTSDADASTFLIKDIEKFLSEPVLTNKDSFKAQYTYFAEYPDTPDEVHNMQCIFQDIKKYDEE